MLAEQTGRLLDNPWIRKKVLDLCEWVVEQLSENTKIHASVAKILVTTLQSEWVSDQAAYWIVEVLKREDTGKGTREALITSVLKNPIMTEQATKTAETVIAETLNSPETFKGGKEFLLTVLRDPEIQRDASSALWGVLKKSILGGSA
eukprot:GDKJ01012707.1.p1 GENE.GDKJ01012707.1~~GDKJ01012707.1.p1  ORF type:complete len:148 (+),score=32.70 GDKJ01012707.1:115-558(+)